MLEQLIYDHYLKSNIERSAKVFKPEDTVYFNPSSFSACKRQIYYKKRCIIPSNPIDATALLKMQFGTVLHASIQSVIKRLGILIESEKLRTKEFGGLRFRYKTDGIIVLKKQRHIMEIKTVSSGGLRVVRDEPKVADVVQMVLYMIFEEIANGVLLYVGRDSAFIEEYSIHKGDYLYNRALDTIHKKIKELKVLEGNIKSGILPDRDCQIALKNKDGKILEKFQKNKIVWKTSWQCSFCAYKDMCWKSELNEIKKHKFFLNNKFID